MVDALTMVESVLVVVSWFGFVVLFCDGGGFCFVFMVVGGVLVHGCIVFEC